MSAMKPEPRFQQTPSPPSPPMDCHVTRDLKREADFSSNTDSRNPSHVMAKPEITFSIERILGLNSYRSDRNSGVDFSPNIHQTSTAVRRDVCDRYTAAIQRGYVQSHLPSSAGTHSVHRFGDEDYEEEDVDEDDVDEIDDDDEEEEDDEYIDVDADGGDVGSKIPSSNRNMSMMSGYSKFDLNEEATKYQWLQCTRYHPPKIQRSKKAVAKKRKLGRNPRVPFTPHQVSVLEEKFRRTHYLSSMDVVELSTALNLTETRVKIWFQNRRARERRDKEASQRNQTTSVIKNNSNNHNNNNIPNKPNNFQPLTIPSVAWPITSPMTTGNYPCFDDTLNFRPGYLSSAFRLYSPFAAAAAAAAAAGTGGVGVDSIDTKQVPE